MIIGAKAIGASRGFLYIRNEYPLAIKRVELALRQARDYGLLGQDILGSGFDFEAEIVRGAGAFVSGEETALDRLDRRLTGHAPPTPALSGPSRACGRNRPSSTTSRRGPTFRPSSAAGRLGSLPWARRRAKAQRSSRLVGKINNTGLVEVPMGIRLRDIVYGHRRRHPRRPRFQGRPDRRAVRRLHSQRPDRPADRLRKPEAGRGHDGLGRPDRHGRRHLHGRHRPVLPALHHGGVLRQVLALPRRHAADGRDPGPNHRRARGRRPTSTDCSSWPPRSATARSADWARRPPNPVLSTLRYFREEYRAHIVDKSCPACVCKNLTTFFIEPEKCIGCLLCLKACPVKAIAGERKKIHVIDQAACIKCGACFAVCPAKVRAVSKFTGEKGRALAGRAAPAERP